MDFNSIPPQDRATVFQHWLSTTQTTTITTEIESLLRLKVIAPSHQSSCLWISPTFTTTNKDGTSLLILNLMKLNLLITHIPFKMESIKDVIRMIKQGVWMALIFHFCGKINTITTSGFPMAMHRFHVFTKLLRLPFGYLRSQGHLPVVYMDDSYLPGDSISSCQTNIANTVSLLQALGFNINRKKLVLTPTQSLEFLGFILNSVNMTITLTRRRKSNI